MQQNNHDVWELTGALRQQEPIAGVDSVYMYTGGDKQITALELARRQGYGNAWYPNAEENYGTGLVACPEFLPGHEWETDGGGKIQRFQIMKTGPNAPKFGKEYDELPVPDDGEYYTCLCVWTRFVVNKKNRGGAMRSTRRYLTVSAQNTWAFCRISSRIHQMM
ncbi:MAG: hypothetical protein LBP35_01710 [Candidatus Ancillula trichonymphae]|jgi:hypothetical protein|nr:hypothetical protein [Candidatus Ancillula trichonymphae]